MKSPEEILDQIIKDRNEAIEKDDTIRGTSHSLTIEEFQKVIIIAMKRWGELEIQLNKRKTRVRISISFFC